MDVSMYQSMDGKDITSFEGCSSIGLCEGAIDGALSDVVELGDLLDNEGVSAAMRSGTVRVSPVHLPFLSVS
jgi:hypothetical protein